MVLPEGGDVGRQLVLEGDTPVTRGVDGGGEVVGVVEDDGVIDEVFQPGGAVGHVLGGEVPQLTQAVEERGPRQGMPAIALFNIWMDSQIEPGSRYRDEIQSALEKSQAVVVFWSKGSVKADFVLDEASPTKEARKLVPVRIDGTQPPAGFGQLQTIDMFQVPCFPYSGNKGLDTLIRALTDKFNQRTDIYTVYLSECESEEYERLRRVASRLKIFLVSANQEHLIFVSLARYFQSSDFRCSSCPSRRKCQVVKSCLC